MNFFTYLRQRIPSSNDKIIQNFFLKSSESENQKLTFYGSVLAFASFLILIRWFLKQKIVEDKYKNGSWDYDKLKQLLKGEKLPAFLVDLDIFAENVKRFAQIAKKNGKTIRIATKSIRVPHLIQLIFQIDHSVFKGLMTFSVPESEFLAQQGFDDFLVAYPTVQKSDLYIAWKLTIEEKKIITLMIDSIQHVDLLDAFWEEKINQQRETSGNKQEIFTPLRVCIDCDMSYRKFNGLIHLGVHRSPIHSIEDFAKIVKAIKNSKHLKLVGIMGYEAQIAGLPDSNPASPFFNIFLKAFKSFSTSDVKYRRAQLRKWLEANNIELEFFNGGGSGDIKRACVDPSLTEVTAGSGFLQSNLFDYFAENENQCAFVFALQSTRSSSKNSIVCQSGGFIASGEISHDKQPVPFLPKGLKPYSSEGFGEVQTPLMVPKDVTIHIGDPVFF